MVNTIIKSKKLKSIIDDIKKEQLDNKLTNIERLEDWEESNWTIASSWKRFKREYW